METILVTGGNGKLATTLKQMKKGLICLGRQEMDITNEKHVKEAFSKYQPTICIHLAANTNLNYCEKNRQEVYNVHVTGTQYIADACREHNIYLIYTSTDYVFDGEKGMYRETDFPNPKNFFALTKLLGEFEVKRAPQHLIIRGTMKARGPWKHPVAPIDMFQSLLYYDEFAQILLALIERKATGIYHIGNGKFNIYEWAKKLTPNLQETTLDKIPLPLPRDCSLDCTKLNSIIDVKKLLGGR
ncbi:MAG: NAD(P)-dependent oxidoreductase [Thermoplasmata archaeon]